jgi:hypothetical protein
MSQHILFRPMSSLQVEPHPFVNCEHQADGTTGPRSEMCSDSHVILLLAQQELLELEGVEMHICLPPSTYVSSAKLYDLSPFLDDESTSPAATLAIG